MTPRERQALALNMYVLAQHGYVERAAKLAEAMVAAGDRSAEIVLARAVLNFLRGRWSVALSGLEELDRISPIERFGSYRLDERQRMRRYLKSRCLFELGEKEGFRDALEVYLRHGPPTTKEIA